MSDELTLKQRIFCRAYLAKDFHITKAALEAGASAANAANWGSETLKKPEIQQYLENLMEKIENKLEMTVEWKLKKLKNCINGSMDDSDENNINIKNHNAFLGAMTEASKIQGHYKEKPGVEDKLDQMNEKLNELRAQYRKDY